MKESQVQQSDKDEWRDHVLQEIVGFLSSNKEEIENDTEEAAEEGEEDEQSAIWITCICTYHEIYLQIINNQLKWA